MDATIETTTVDATHGQAVHRAFLTEHWSSEGFHVWFDSGVVSDTEDAVLGPLVRHGNTVSALNQPVGFRGCYGKWHPTKAKAVEAVVDELRKRILTLHGQCDRLITSLRNDATE